jgi:hypothetical protein
MDGTTSPLVVNITTREKSIPAPAKQKAWIFIMDVEFT